MYHSNYFIKSNIEYNKSAKNKIPTYGIGSLVWIRSNSVIDGGS